jgi:hypothetical protein
MEPIQELKFEVPPAVEVGAHADAASVWHTPESFIIDFLALRRPPEATEMDDGQVVVTHDMVVSARVRIPPTHVIELMKALETELSRWEGETGQREIVEPPHPDLG